MTAVVIAAITGIAVQVAATVWAQWSMRRDLRNYMRESRERWTQ